MSFSNGIFLYTALSTFERFSTFVVVKHRLLLESMCWHYPLCLYPMRQRLVQFKFALNVLNLTLSKLRVGETWLFTLVMDVWKRPRSHFAQVSVRCTFVEQHLAVVPSESWWLRPALFFLFEVLILSVDDSEHRFGALVFGHFLCFFDDDIIVLLDLFENDLVTCVYVHSVLFNWFLYSFELQPLHHAHFVFVLVLHKACFGLFLFLAFLGLSLHFFLLLSKDFILVESFLFVSFTFDFWSQKLLKVLQDDVLSLLTIVLNKFVASSKFLLDFVNNCFFMRSFDVMLYNFVFAFAFENELLNSAPVT